jgi:hypothetical protein
MYEIPAGSTDIGKPKFRRKSFPSAILSFINLKRAGLISKPNPRVQRPVVRSPSSGTMSLFST